MMHILVARVISSTCFIYYSVKSIISQDKAAANQGGLREPETWLRGANTGEPKAPRRGRGTACLAYQPCKFYSHQPAAPFRSALPYQLGSHHHLSRGACQDRFLFVLLVSARAARSAAARSTTLQQPCHGCRPAGVPRCVCV